MAKNEFPVLWRFKIIVKPIKNDIQLSSDRLDAIILYVSMNKNYGLKSITTSEITQSFTYGFRVE